MHEYIKWYLWMVGFLNSILIVKPALLFFKSEVFTIFLVNVGAEWRKPRELNLLRCAGVTEKNNSWMKDHLLFSSSGRISFSFTMLKLIWLSSCPNKSFTFCHNLIFHLKGTETVAELEVEVCKLFEVCTLENMVGSRHSWRASVRDPFLKERKCKSMEVWKYKRVKAWLAASVP